MLFNGLVAIKQKEEEEEDLGSAEVVLLANIVPVSFPAANRATYKNNRNMRQISTITY